MLLRAVAVFFGFVACDAQAASPHKEVIVFSMTNDVGPGNSVFVVGNHSDLGSDDVTHALKLRSGGGNLWTGQVAVQSGTQLHYHYIKRSTAQNLWCKATNSIDLTGTLTLSIPMQSPAPYVGKTIYYLSGWNTANLLYNHGGTFVSVPMTRVGSGRSAGESLFRVNGIGEAGENIEFVFTDGIGSTYHPPGGGNFFTRIDIFEVQDGNVFAYQPPANISAPRIMKHTVGSSVPGIPARDVHVYLPRGYDQNTTRHYPVVYFHDGQNVFDASTAFVGVEWQADETATREIGQGRMREAILVAIDNNSARIEEYRPPNDSFDGRPGRADAYAGFVINNVRPFIDNTYRTLNDPKNTVTIGSALGGLVSLYLGREFSTFGKIGVMSPSLWIAPNFVAQMNGEPKKPMRVHVDFGTNESQSGFNDALSMYDLHLAQNYAANDDVEFVAGCGQQHNETAWSARLPEIFDFLLPAIEGPDELAQRDYPPTFGVTAVDLANVNASFNYTGLLGFTYTLQRSSDLVTWTAISTTRPETLPWSNRSLIDSSFVPVAKNFWRLRVDPLP